MTEEREKELETILTDISKILSSEKPPEVTRVPICRRCSYYELCWC